MFDSGPIQRPLRTEIVNDNPARDLNARDPGTPFPAGAEGRRCSKGAGDDRDDRLAE
jgi:hypothetical protein